MEANQLIAATSNSVITRSFELARDQHDQPHSHPWHQLLLPRSGMLRTRTPENMYFIPANRGALIPAGVSHESWALAQAQFVGIYFAPSLYPAALEACRIIEITPLIDALIEETLQIARDWSRPHAEPEARLLAVLIDRLAASETIDLSVTLPQDKRLLPIIQELLTRPASSRTLAQWSRTVGASERTITRLFARHTGLGFSQWRRKVRMVSALSLLEEGRPVQEVALAAGYSTASAFIHSFRGEFGVTPQQYFGGARV